MRAWSSARFSIPLPPDHRFPIAKYAMIREEIVARGLLGPEGIEEPDPVSLPALLRVHAGEYVEAIRHAALGPAEARRLGFPACVELWERSARTVQGTVEACADALRNGAGINLAGGTHHAYPGHGEGYCVFNDVAVAIRGLQAEGVLRRVAVVDLDVHQGNGTAAIFANDDDVFTFSMHGANNYPFRKEDSRLDIALSDGVEDAEYLRCLDEHLDTVLGESTAELVIYLAGADPYLDDRLGRLRLSMEGLRRRDRTVFSACHGLGVPVAMVLGGGYARNLSDVAAIHAQTVQELLVYF